MDRRKNKSEPELSPTREVNRRGVYSRYAVSGLFILAGISQAKLQIAEKDSTIKMATDMKRYVLAQDDPAKRGEILARGGEPLARDDNVADLTIDFKKCPNTEAFWLDLSKASGVPSTQLSQFAQEAAASNYSIRSRVWPKSVRQSDWVAINEVRSKWRADGVSRVAGGYREYPLADEASCLVGIIRPRYVVVPRNSSMWEAAVKQNGQPEPGKNAVADDLTGLEKSQDQLLRGRDGRKVGVTDRNGQFLPMRIQSQIPKVDGQNITLTIDRDLQSYAAQAVKSAVDQFHAESGVAVIENPANGDILAIVNYPSFKPYTADGNYGSLGTHGGLNQAYMSCLEPGSMFKILTLAKALDSGVVHMNDTFFCPGEKVVVPHSKPIKCALESGKRAHGLIDPIHAIAQSCNIWAATWARQIGYDPFVKYLSQLGIFSKPDIGVPSAVKALFDKHDAAKQLQLANLGFGQAVNVTAVSLLGAFSTLANDGIRVPPRLVEKIGDKTLAPNPGIPVLSSASCRDVVKGMIATLEDHSGTGKSLRIPGYQIAGKTGTAQKIGKNNSGHVSNFVGFVPAIHPKAAIIVMINKPLGPHYYGAEVAGPVFRSLALEVIRKYHIAQNEAIVKAPPKPSEALYADDEASDSDEAVSKPITKPKKKNRSTKSRGLDQAQDGQVESPRKTRSRKSKRIADDA